MTRFDEQQEFFETEFKSVVYKNKRLIRREFESCVFDRCSLQESQFFHCKFSNCRFVNCNLTMFNVEGSSFKEVKFEKCKVAGVNWTLAKWSKFIPDAAIAFEDCVLNFSTFLGLALKGLILRGCVAHDVDFSEADLSKADFSKTDLSRSQFRHTNLTGANFATAFNYSLSVTLNEVKKARFALPEAINLLRALEIELVDEEF